MRIVQLIDSLEAGGAEKMAVSYANSLADTIAFSGLVVTRYEGPLYENVSQKENYLFLNKKKIVDLKALIVFKKYLKKNEIAFIHAHSTSVYFALLVKLLLPKIKIIWHDHYGNSEMLYARKFIFLKIISRFLFGIISVNDLLKKWATTKLSCKNSIYLPNFTKSSIINNSTKTILKGVDGKRILCLANLRPQKNHQMLLNIAKNIHQLHQDYTFHLVGKDFKDGYSQEIKKTIQQYKLEETVFIYDSKPDVMAIIYQATIGILTSKSEGLPVALLEYGIGKLAVVCTHVGEIPSIIKNDENGYLIDVNNETAFIEALKILINNKDKRLLLGQNLYNDITKRFNNTQTINDYIKWITQNLHLKQ